MLLTRLNYSRRSFKSPAQRRTGPRSDSICCCQGQHHQQTADKQWPSISRRDLALSAPFVLLLSSANSVLALEAEAPAPAAEAPAPGNSTSSAPSPILERFLDNTFELQVPSNYTYIETPIVRVERGPQPERSPVLGRFEAPNGQPGIITIVTQRAQTFKQTVLQLSDISQLGDPIEVAKLLLPRGSTLLATTTLQVPQPAKETPLGLVEIPPQNYYIFEFKTSTGLRVATSVAAKKGSVIICGASTSADQWAQAGPVFSKVVKSFRLRSQPTIS